MVDASKNVAPDSIRMERVSEVTQTAGQWRLTLTHLNAQLASACLALILARQLATRTALSPAPQARFPARSASMNVERSSLHGSAFARLVKILPLSPARILVHLLLGETKAKQQIELELTSTLLSLQRRQRRRRQDFPRRRNLRAASRLPHRSLCPREGPRLRSLQGWHLHLRC